MLTKHYPFSAFSSICLFGLQCFLFLQCSTIQSGKKLPTLGDTVSSHRVYSSCTLLTNSAYVQGMIQVESPTQQFYGRFTMSIFSKERYEGTIFGPFGIPVAIFKADSSIFRIYETWTQTVYEIDPANTSFLLLPPSLSSAADLIDRIFACFPLNESWQTASSLDTLYRSGGNWIERLIVGDLHPSEYQCISTSNRSARLGIQYREYEETDNRGVFPREIRIAFPAQDLHVSLSIEKLQFIDPSILPTHTIPSTGIRKKRRW